jgi:hypothetical protein
MAVVTGSAARAQQGEEPDPPKVKLPALLSAKALAALPGDDEPRKLLKAKYNEAAGEAKSCYKEFLRGSFNRDELYGAYKRLVQAGLELADKQAERVELLARYVETTAEAEQIMQERFKVARGSIGDVHRARYERLDAEIRVLRARREPEKTKDK